MVKFLQILIKCTSVALATNDGGMVSVCLADIFHLTTSIDGKLHYTACCVSGAVKLVEC